MKTIKQDISDGTTTAISNRLKCPKCSADLKEFYSQDLKLARCFSCKGIWFDKNELKKVIDERDKDLAWMHFDLWREKEKFGAFRGQRLCPKCKKAMAALKYDKSEVETDVCADCGGVWLDSGEFTKIVDFLEKALLAKDVPGYIKEVAKEGERMVLNPLEGASEAGHILILAKLLQYRILAEHSFIASIISALPK